MKILLSKTTLEFSHSLRHKQLPRFVPGGNETCSDSGRHGAGRLDRARAPRRLGGQDRAREPRATAASFTGMVEVAPGQGSRSRRSRGVVTGLGMVEVASPARAADLDMVARIEPAHLAAARGVVAGIVAAGRDLARRARQTTAWRDCGPSRGGWQSPQSGSRSWRGSSLWCRRRARAPRRQGGGSDRGGGRPRRDGRSRRGTGDGDRGQDHRGGRSRRGVDRGPDRGGGQGTSTWRPGSSPRTSPRPGRPGSSLWRLGAPIARDLGLTEAPVSAICIFCNDGIRGTRASASLKH